MVHDKGTVIIPGVVDKRDHCVTHIVLLPCQLTDSGHGLHIVATQGYCTTPKSKGRHRASLGDVQEFKKKKKKSSKGCYKHSCEKKKNVSLLTKHFHWNEDSWLLNAYKTNRAVSKQRCLTDTAGNLPEWPDTHTF